MAVVTPGQRGRVPGRVRQVGRRGHRHRRGDRHRPAGDDLARRVVADIPPGTAADGPVYDRPAERGPRPGRAGRRTTRRRRRARPTVPGTARDPAGPDRLARAWPTRAGSPSSTTATSAATPCWPCRTTAAWSGWTRRPGSASRWPPTATAATPLDPYQGTQLALSEAYRNVAITGARPLAVTNCLNFGSPEDPAVMWQFAEAVRGLADGCAALGVPVTGGNVSSTTRPGPTAIHPTPVIGVLGVHDDVRRRLSTGFPAGANSCCSAGPRPSSAVRPGRTCPRSPRRAPAGTDCREHRWPGCWPRRPPPGCWPPPTTCPRRAGSSRWPSPACGAARLPGPAPGDPLHRCSAVGGAGPWRCVPARGNDFAALAPRRRAGETIGHTPAATTWLSRAGSRSRWPTGRRARATLPALSG